MGKAKAKTKSGKRSGRDTPLMQQYLRIKASHPDAVLFFRCGDFYEMFFDDAVIASELLDIALTSRNKDAAEPIPMAGVPHHAARGYIARLTELGRKVVVAEQMEDPKQTKGIVRREIARVVTPGVVLDDEVLDPKQARYLAAVALDPPAAGPSSKADAARLGLALLDVSTGEFRATEMDSVADLIREVVRAQPREILLPASAGDALAPLRQAYPDTAYSTVPNTGDGTGDDTGDGAGADADRALLESILSGTLADFGLTGKPRATRAAAAAVAYARATQPAGTLPLSRVVVYAPGESVVLDETAIANLELTETLIGRRKRGSLLAVIDATRTAPGGRMLRQWLLYPLTEVAPIRRRQDAIEHLVVHGALRRELREALRGVYDLERLTARVSLGAATPRDVGRLRDSLAQLPALGRLLTDADAAVAADAVKTETAPGADADFGPPALLVLPPALLAPLADLYETLNRALVDEPTAVAKDGGFIRPGFCAVVDEQHQLASGGRDAILAIETRERERTGIGSLKVKYNRVFGYYIEVTRSNLDRVPDDYTRKQTIATGERYVTGELAELEARILGAQEVLGARELELLGELCGAVVERAEALTEVGARIATIDCCAALAEVAATHRYVRPTVDDSEVLDIVDGRHPVIEQMTDAGSFVPNDCRLDTADGQILLITGPNMAGKSTYMRQVAHIVLLAQMGSFVPAARATIGVVDRVFTRVGAADNLARGESTFMVEMRETAAILSGATRRSLVVLDEVGRGTSTFDGVSIAWAVTEYLHDAIGARTLFATHYHELGALAETRGRIRNVSVAVRRVGGDIVFLRQVIAGGADRSYGIDVAKLAGLPRSVIARGRQILGQLEGGASLGNTAQLSLFSVAQASPESAPEADADAARGQAVLDRLAAIDPDRLTPIEALSLLAELRALARE